MARWSAVSAGEDAGGDVGGQDGRGPAAGGGHGRLRRLLVVVPVVLVVAWIIGGWGQAGDDGGAPGPEPSAAATITGAGD